MQARSGLVCVWLLAAPFVAACQSQSGPNLAPTPAATASDPEWIKSYDADLMAKESYQVSNHSGSPDSQVVLWQNLECLRRVYIAQARAVDVAERTEGLSRADAVAKVQVDPNWTIAQQGCR